MSDRAQAPTRYARARPTFCSASTLAGSLAYQREMRVCDREYPMSLSFTAFCRAEVAGRYSHHAVKTVSTPRQRFQAASAALAFSAIAWNATGSLIARSDSTLRSTTIPDLDRPSIKRL
jgi:hypothetical protein